MKKIFAMMTILLLLVMACSSNQKNDEEIEQGESEQEEIVQHEGKVAIPPGTSKVMSDHLIEATGKLGTLKACIHIITQKKIHLVILYQLVMCF